MARWPAAGARGRCTGPRGICHLGVGQNETTRGPQVLVHASIHQGSISGTFFDPQPFQTWGVTPGFTTGLDGGSTWVSHGSYMGLTWVLHGFYTGFHGFYMGLKTATTSNI